MSTQNPSQPGPYGASQGAPKYPPPPQMPPHVPVSTYAGPVYSGVHPAVATAQQPPNRMVLSIVALLFSIIFGAIGLYFSTQVTTRWNAGDIEGARKASNVALVVDIIGIVIGVLFLLATLSSSGY